MDAPPFHEEYAASLADEFDQHPLAPPPVELAIEDMIPLSRRHVST
jgi:hypothetical protein